MTRYFGTDGIRGIVPDGLNFEIAFHLGNGLTKIKRHPKIIVGGDTRRSSNYIISALSSGVLGGGGDVLNLGVASTPKISFLTKEYAFDFGVVVSASHNPSEYNGIKVFNHSGEKVSELVKEQLEEHIFQGTTLEMNNENVGVVINKNISRRYEEFLLGNCRSLKGVKIVLDYSFGATIKAGSIFRELGAKVVEISKNPNGLNINKNCGALYPQKAIELVKEKKADIGFCFDGDGDRVIAINEKGEIVDGDGIIYCLAKWYQKNNKLKNNLVIGTKQTNFGLENALSRHGISLIRSDVGDSFVVEKMRDYSAILGGESSGHIIIGDKLMTGDGVLAALTLTEALIFCEKSLSEYMDFSYYPSYAINAKVKSKTSVFRKDSLSEYVKNENSELEGRGRVLLRMSGTEEVIRVLVECDSNTEAKKRALDLNDLIKKIDDEIEVE